MGLLSLLFKDPAAFVLLVIPLLYSIIIHEVAHGWVANKMGDPTAKWLGRLTLDPRGHLDPVGTIMLFIFGFGWAKPVPVNFNNLKHQRKGLIFVSAAGIAANILLAFLALLTRQLLDPQSRTVITVLVNFAGINIMLAAFNLIPIPPLDGSKILMGFTSRRFQYSLARLEPYGLLIIMGLLWLRILDPVISFLEWAILRLLSVLIP
ncbi:MAG TPA: site-2 protease family protein [Syntrophorhabdales bacterium]|nr:site-2 protease family protein [Syntrophorhabdales bacterium]